MINILIHGLGQDNNSWSLIKKYFNDKNVNVEVPNLYNLNNREMTFLNLYNLLKLIVIVLILKLIYVDCL